MNAAKILEELPNLSLADLERVFQRAMELQLQKAPRDPLHPSQELLDAIDQATAVSGPGIHLEEALRIVRSWGTR